MKMISGLLDYNLNCILPTRNSTLYFNRRSIHQSGYQKEDGEFYNSPSIFVFVVHLAFMTLFGFTSMHVQVSMVFPFV